MNKIIKLPPDTARKIAAGEVIERPQSVIRELLDNAIDAEADRITVTIKQGGLDVIQVSDNGTGIYKEDLELAIEPHATSKIAHIDDLLHLHTLGFRGEALASISAVAELEIISAVEHGNGARLFSIPGVPVSVEPYGASKGTTVTVRNLFANFPARKKFLKYPHAEALACKQTFIEKALPFPQIEFLFTHETSNVMLGKETLIKRVHNLLFADLPFESTAEIPVIGDSFRGSIITASPSFSRKDRRLLQVYVNNRKIQEFSLLQAVEYAFRDQLPGGVFPCAIIILTIYPELVDFNVHPAKKEARIKNITDIRTNLISAVKQYLKTLLPVYTNSCAKFTETMSNELFKEQGSNGTNNFSQFNYPQTSTFHDLAYEKLNNKISFQQQNQTNLNKKYSFIYHGQFLLTFLIFEIESSLYILDQHAAHERILYDTMLSQKIVSQELLIPYTYEAKSKEEESLLAALKEKLAEVHIILEQDKNTWQITQAPAFIPDEALGNIFSQLLEKGDAEAAIKHTLATIACRAAVKEGELLDEASACSLIAEALSLKDPHCPHGRPLWIEITQKELYSRIGRSI